MKNKIIAILVVIMILIVSLPINSFAVDPVSAATMANALAQAITAYGASQGVSMTFDVTNTDGIGEGVKKLWDNFKADMEDDPDYSGPVIQNYDTMSVSTWATLYKKIGNKVGIDLKAEVVSAFDGFWNWLLSGPAEMTKVDNQYYQWSINQDNSVTPITVIRTGPFPDIPYLSGSPTIENTYYVGLQGTDSNNRPITERYYTNTLNVINFTFAVPSTGSQYNYLVYVASAVNNSIYQCIYTNNQSYIEYTKKMSSQSGYNLYCTGGSPLESINPDIPVFSTKADGLTAINSYLVAPTDNVISVCPYIGDTTPQNVYIPDNQDVNYEPIPVAIPLDVYWDDSIYGDGTDTLTDSQAQDISDALDNAITEDPAKTLELADTITPIPEPTEVYIPFLPVDLPNFEFSLSGIWHYVRDWVASLGSWFSMVFTIWSHLPYAIVVPVYASAVIVIVLGVYRRFFM